MRQIVFGESGAAIAGVMINGRKVLWDGKMQTIDEAKLRSRVEEASQRLIRSNADARALSERLEDFIGAFCVAQSRRLGPCGACGAIQ